MKKIDPESRLKELTKLWTECLKDVAVRGLTVVAKNGYECLNPAAKLLVSVDARIRQLQLDLEKKEEDLDLRDALDFVERLTNDE